MRSRSAVAVFLAAALLTVSGCTSHGISSGAKAGTCLGAATASAGSVVTGPDASTADSAGVAGTAQPTPTGVQGTPGGPRMPDLSLACYDGSGDVRLDSLDRPAIISLWASWCQPCQQELPHLAAFAGTVGPAVAVVGVDTDDTRSAASSVIHDLGLTYPMVVDPDQRLYATVAGAGLPATVFVAPGGQIRYVYESARVLDQQTIASLTAKYLGVTVPG